ncbi:hypothetical protein Mal15_68790 [Stieleria maiorica]|uniref:DUF3618 domain-containing protein n=1 Tax=Stieleria maiorica TaxID=2795974 RepID=A0A5B9MUN4_9BACT|nr:hypothetical protein [Stieleria maiorica]QEG02758.1 hypothetical protein Mal15_68790 [Stieleria maiorica]
MANTLATRKQAEAIKQRMSEIRTELPYDVDDARRRVRQLSDWKYHLARHPLPVLAVAVGIGYLLVPKKHSGGEGGGRGSAIGHCNCSAADTQTASPPTVKRGFVGGVTGAIASLAMRQLTSIAASQINHLLSKPKTP